MDKEPLIIHGPEPIYEPGPGGIGFECYRSLQLHKNKPARYIIDTGETCTFGDLFVRSKKLAIYLKSKNLKKDDVVCLCSHNTIHATIPFYAAKFIDVAYASIEPTMPEDDLIYLLDYAKPKILFVAENVEDKIDQCIKKANIQAEIIILGKSENKPCLEKIMTETPDEEFSPAFVEDLKETAIIFFSSGTTGKPKGICCNHYGLVGKLINVAARMLESGSWDMSNHKLELGENLHSNTLVYSPMYWISGVAFILLSTFHGSMSTLGAQFNAETFWETLHKLKVTTIFMPPGEVVDSYLLWKEKNYKANYDLRTFVTGGGPVRRYHMEYLSEMFPKAANLQVLGMTEASGMVTVYDRQDPKSLELQLKYPESCGLIINGTSIKIVDVDTEEVCNYNEQGELRIKTRYLMNGYYKMDTSPCYDKEGWFKTGDLAYINDDNCLVIVDRLKDILLYTLYNIRPSIIEEILVKHPSVHECFVIGIPHPTDNEHPMGVVKLKEEQNGNIKPEEILEFVNERVPSDRYKIRAGIKIVKEMIKTPTGKIRKLVMKKMILEGQI